MKFFTFVLFTFLAVSGSAQCRIDSVITYERYGTVGQRPAVRKILKYDGRDSLQSRLTQNNLNGRWVNDMKTTRSYDQAGRLQADSFAVFMADRWQWVYAKSYVYNDSGAVVETFKSYISHLRDFRNLEMNVSVRKIKGVPDSTLWYSWDTLNARWGLAGAQRVERDANQNPLTVTNFQKDQTGVWWPYMKTTRVYNLSGQWTRSRRYTGSASSGQLTLRSEDTALYLSGTITYLLRKNYSNQQQSLVNAMQVFHQKDRAGRDSSVVYQFWNGSAWDNYSENVSLNYNDEAYPMLKITRADWNGTSYEYVDAEQSYCSIHHTEIKTPEPLPVLLYPSPANEFLWIASGSKELVQVVLYDLRGVPVSVQTEQEAGRLKLVTSGLPEGVYCLSFVLGGQSLSYKVSVMH